MGMRYSASFEEVAVTAAQDLFELVAPTDACIIVHSVRIGQSSDPADAEAEMLPIAIVRGEGTVTSGSGGSSPTKAPLESGFAASGATLEANNTTKMVVGTGTLTVLLNDTFNAQVGWLYQPVPEERIVISPGDRITIELVTAPVDSLDMNGAIVWEEIGG
jgi:hypothetical protein